MSLHALQHLNFLIKPRVTRIVVDRNIDHLGKNFRLLEKIVNRGGSRPVGAKLLLPERDEKKNIERPTSNVEWKKQKN